MAQYAMRLTFVILPFSPFQDFVPLIGVMCNKGMRGRHWKRMSSIAGFDLTPDSGTTLRKMLKLDLGPFMEQFEGISAAGMILLLLYFTSSLHLLWEITRHTSHFL